MSRVMDSGEHEAVMSDMYVQGIPVTRAVDVSEEVDPDGNFDVTLYFGLRQDVRYVQLVLESGNQPIRSTVARLGPVVSGEQDGEAFRRFIKNHRLKLEAALQLIMRHAP